MAFATHTDVATRLGRTLTATQQAAATAVIETVEGLIVEVSGEAAPATVPAYYRALAIEKAVGVLSRPEPAIAAESLGEHSVTYARETTSGVFLTALEELQVRRIANNAVSGSVRTRSLLHDVYRADKPRGLRKGDPQRFVKGHHYRRVPLEHRFWAKVDKADGDLCWLWGGTRIGEGYGQIWNGERQKMEYAHRVSYELAHGAIPDGLLVLHSCDNPPCVNPAHLFIGSQSDNIRDCVAKGRWRNPRFAG